MSNYSEWEERIKRLAEEALEEGPFLNPQKYVRIVNVHRDKDIFKQLHVFVFECACDRCSEDFFEKISIPVSAAMLSPLQPNRLLIEKMDALRCKSCNARLYPGIFNNVNVWIGAIAKG